MNRRAFLQTAIAGLATLAIDPERLLWVPGKKTVFIPPQRLTLNGNYSVSEVSVSGGGFVIQRTINGKVPDGYYSIMDINNYDQPDAYTHWNAYTRGDELKTREGAGMQFDFKGDPAIKEVSLILRDTSDEYWVYRGNARGWLSKTRWAELPEDRCEVCE